MALLAAVADGALAATKPDLLVITVDTLRGDALGWIGGKNATPAIDALAAASWRFPRAVAPVPLTLPSHASIFTGLVPRRHGVRDNGRVLSAAGPETLAQRLRAAGYDTAAVVSGYPLAAQFGLDRGFALYDDRFLSGPGDRLERSAAATARAAAEWWGKSAAPKFLWVHFYDPHDPYAGATGTDPSALRAAYDGEVRAVDRAVGELLAAADRAPRPRLTIFTADHGESLGEHGESTHGFFIYQSTIELPLLFHFPGRVGAGESPERVGLVDLAPTVLDLLGIPPWNDRDGAALSLGRLGGNERPPRPLFVESLRPWHSYGWAPLAAVIDGDWKLIAAPRPELYDLRSDPGERANRIDAERPRARRLERLLRDLPPAAEAAAADDPETVAKLRALGYVGPTVRATPVEPRGLPDPKDRIAIWNELGDAEEALELGDPRGALVRFDSVLAADPHNPFALARSAEALIALNEAKAAEARLEQALIRAPDQPEIRVALATVLSREGRYEEAIAHWMELARRTPRDISAWLGLGAALGLAGRPLPALEAMGRAAALAPDRPEVRVRVAFAAVGAGDLVRAVSELRRAAELSPPGAFRHAGSLGVLLDDLGRPDEARTWLQASRPGERDFGEARYRLALALARAGDEKGARAALAEAVRADPALRSRAAASATLTRLLPPP